MHAATCAIEDCDSLIFSKYMCLEHWQTYQPVIKSLLHPRKSDRERIDYRFSEELVLRPDGCLEWLGSRNEKGYGLITAAGRLVGVHRLAWTLAHGPIPADMYVCHHCDNPPCAQTDPTPDYPEGHLFLGTAFDNTTDMIIKGRGAWQK